MAAPGSTPAPAQQPSPALALLSAIAIAMVAQLLFGPAEAGSSAVIGLPAYSLVIGGLALVAARYAVRTWRAVSATPSGAGAGRTAGLTLTFLALLIDLAVIGFALVLVLMMTVGIGIA